MTPTPIVEQPQNATNKQAGTQNQTARYVYDGTDTRVGRIVNGTVTVQSYDVSGSLPTLLMDGYTAYIYGPDQLPLEQVSVNPTNNSNTVRYYHHDQLGSTRALTDQNGRATATYTYDAYGNLQGNTPAAAATTNPLLYASQYTDPETGLEYLRARTYDPATGQFLSVDPLVAQTHQPYSYAFDNPTNVTDPSGLCGSTSSWGSFWANCGSDATGGASTAWNATGGQVVNYIGNHTIGVCLSLSGGAGVYGSASGCVALVGGTPTAIGTLGFGASSPGVSGTVGLLTSNATTPSELDKWFGVAGASGDLGLAVGDETSFGNSPCGFIGENQVTAGFGLALPVPIQPHAGASYTWTLSP